jgi:hypothetical protein
MTNHGSKMLGNNFFAYASEHKKLKDLLHISVTYIFDNLRLWIEKKTTSYKGQLRIY